MTEEKNKNETKTNSNSNSNSSSNSNSNSNSKSNSSRARLHLRVRCFHAPQHPLLPLPKNIRHATAKRRHRIFLRFNANLRIKCYNSSMLHRARPATCTAISATT